MRDIRYSKVSRIIFLCLMFSKLCTSQLNYKPKECTETLRGNSYNGFKNITISGRICQAWSSQSPHTHRKRHLSDQLNYCRNPDWHSGGPWCYTTDPRERFEECGIPVCKCNVTGNVDPYLRFTNKSYDVSDYIYFSCPSGFELYPSSIHYRQCVANDSHVGWNENFPICQRKECLLNQHSVKNLIYEVKTYRYQDVVTFSCASGYQLFGPASLGCQSSGYWNRTYPRCDPVKCPITDTRARLVYRRAHYTYQDTITFTCPRGYKLVGPANLTCQGDGTFGAPFPRCEDVTCPLPTVTTGLLLTNRTYKYREVITPECSFGYELEGNDYLECTESGQWNADFPVCKGVECTGRPVNAPNLQFRNIVYRFKDAIDFTCKIGYDIYGPSSLTCLGNTSWSAAFPECRAVTCSPPEDIDNLVITNAMNVYYYGDMVNFTCNEGSFLQGVSFAVCKADGQWGTQGSGLPVCLLAQRQREDDENSGGLVAGLTILIIVLILIGVVGALIIFRRRQKRKGSIKRTYSVKVESSVRRNNPDLLNSILSEFDKNENDEKGKVYENIGMVSPRNEYYEFSPLSVLPMGAVNVSDFKQFVESKNALYYAETFETFAVGLQFPTAAAVLPINRSKNKYKSVYPYDQTRVYLETSDEDQSDYINASYINGFQHRNTYVACQGPIKTSLVDFWKMIWQLKSNRIVMLTNLEEMGKMKCLQYWPENTQKQYGSINVKLESVQETVTYTIRNMSVNKGTERRSIVQYHFTAWPDRSVPRNASTLSQFYRKVKSCSDNVGPLIVHCSAGIGRTGTFLAIDYLMSEAETNGYLNVVECVKTLREQRVNMVQTAEQFEFLHHVLVNLLGGQSYIPLDDYKTYHSSLGNISMDSVTQLTKLQREFQQLATASPGIPEREFSDGRRVENKCKNRNSNVLPVERYRPILTSKGGPGSNGYINAVFLLGSAGSQTYIVTQMPLSNTIIDFWRLVYDQQVSTIVMLNEEFSQQEIYWPEEAFTVQFGPFIIQRLSDESFNTADTETYNITYRDQKPRTVKQFRCKFWKDDGTMPKSVMKFLTFRGIVRESHDDQNPLLVHCRNGCDKSGMYCVIDAVLDNIEETDIVDVTSVINEMRKRRPGIITSEEQLQFCHDVILQSTDKGETYQNVN